MDDRQNALLPTGTALPPKPSRYARWSLACGLITIGAVIMSAVLFNFGYSNAARYVALLQLVFPAAIVCGHIAKRQIDTHPDRYTGRNMALLGMYIGYFNLIVAAMILYFIVTRAR